MKIKIRVIFKAVAAGSIAGFVFLMLFPFLLAQLNRYWRIGQWNNLVPDIAGIVMIAGGITIFLYCSGLFARSGKGTPAP